MLKNVMEYEDFSDDNSSYWNTGVICFNGSLNDDEKAAGPSFWFPRIMAAGIALIVGKGIRRRRRVHCKGRSGSRRYV